MERKELIEKYVEFFKSRGHAQISSASLVPENDPTVLFITAGMHPLVPYLLGQKHPMGKRLVDVQKCIRTGDIDEVGDTTHHTFFEMLGNWSLGDYWKEDAIKWSFEFLTEVLKIPIERLGVTAFGGDEDFSQVPKDEESAKIWGFLGVDKKRVAFMKGGVANSDDNWWGPAGKTGPCGPCTEMFYWKPNNMSAPKVFDAEDERWVEIWNDVLMEYVKDKEGNYILASQKNVDTGMGLERTLAVLNGFDDNYLTDVWMPIIKKIEEISKKSYNGNEKAMRVIADHIKAGVFLIGDGVLPSNTERGYVLRRLIRRAIRYGKLIGLENFVDKVALSVFEIYSDYDNLIRDKDKVLEELRKEEERFNLTLEKGLRKFDKMAKGSNEVCGKDCFLLFQSFGFPIEMTKEIAGEKGVEIDEREFEEELKKHQELSRTASAGVFKSGLADDSVATTKLHTAAHLLLSALRDVLKDENIFQKGSNINSERLRLDFSFPRKLTNEEVKEVEDLINAQIQKSCEVVREEMSPEEAKGKGALGVFDDKYGEVVSVYTIGDFSKEICTGPHVKNLCELGHFKIKKQKSVGEGVRRIKAVLE
ncbi:MAG: alanine--tRNA ligase [Candidatus Pacearchaeota archaeon]|nr:alanine--tRNA ligase [Candidatus Pacearchaeota archaeon]